MSFVHSQDAIGEKDECSWSFHTISFRFMCLKYYFGLEQYDVNHLQKWLFSMTNEHR